MHPRLLALDFDGVICDGLAEYFATACRVCQRIWGAKESQLEPLRSVFARLRPLIETGWEMPLLVWGLQQGIAEAELRQDWPAQRQQLLQQSGIPSDQLAQALDQVRDEWIHADLPGWLGLHRFYPGVGAWLRQIRATGEPRLVILSTKEGRFIQQLLQGEGIQLLRHHILGKEVRAPKSTTLQRLLTAAQLPAAELWFVEDRLQTLEQVKAVPALQDAVLFLAGWGYNLPEERQQAAQDPRLHLLELAQLSQPFEHWVSTARISTPTADPTGPLPRLSIAPAGPEELDQLAGSPLIHSPERPEAGLASLVLTLVELLRQLMEAQVVRQMEAERLTPEQIERAGTSLQTLRDQILHLCELFQIDPADLNVDLGDLGTLLPRKGDYYPGQPHREGSLLELLDRLINTGIVIDGEIDLGLAQLDLIHARLKLVLTSSAKLY
ncbi:gas vesicle protein GvpJ [Thermostichus vulcanus]|uniref:Gas vesicle protein K n=1 Tax=Thermostichus vulcanus str. 'Rupite' TaxID=2813851 RepID=A0ABT0CAT3_THEVL|nr:gas vesicle protein GvpJ [Thermostichus vulcanus]MCJ2542899.1 gas vesicle protein K [Thermostichus vulcanus str. 'Rupite']